MTAVTYRPGGADDADAVVHAVIEAGAGLIEYILEGVAPGMAIEKLMSAAVIDPGSPLHVVNAIIADVDGETVGIAIAYSAKRFTLPMELKILMPRKRLNHIRSLFTTKIEDSYYLHALWVTPEVRGLRIGRGLLDVTVETARAKGFDRLSLHVWADNDIARSLYEGFGFEAVATIPIAATRNLNHPAGMILMQAVI